MEPRYQAWLPRFLAHGVDYNDFVSTVADLESWSGWLPAWVETAEAHEQLGEAAAAGGNSRTAGEAFLRASLCYHYAKFLWLEDTVAYWETTERCVASHQRAMGFLDSTFRRLEIPFEDDRIVANLRLPGHAGTWPCVVLVPGMDSAKEEFPVWEDTILSRGMATISLDGPGQGEAGRTNSLRPDHERAVGALIDVLATRDEIDDSRIGITGVGMGGYFATRVAAFEPRITAAGVIGGAYRFSRMPEIIKQKFMFSSRIDVEEEAESYADTFTTEGIMERVLQPYLVIHGARDAVMPPEQARRAADQAPRGEFFLYPDGNTACQSVNHKLRPFLADWFGARLDVG